MARLVNFICAFLLGIPAQFEFEFECFNFGLGIDFRNIYIAKVGDAANLLI
ncbi:Uncharacterised protein [Shigella sonnei]|nr:Uncharacterised protein [Shigella sonnei]